METKKKVTVVGGSLSSKKVRIEWKTKSPQAALLQSGHHLATNE